MGFTGDRNSGKTEANEQYFRTAIKLDGILCQDEWLECWRGDPRSTGPGEVPLI